ncbi:hypothetical protein [Oryzifoliimicrobium ureilyticus]|uniref:hypothetical protein n=1 Tax=Oryzifoliimicrobium ureilyticus TaxID=3113724 RepID=UPI0030760E80
MQPKEAAIAGFGEVLLVKVDRIGAGIHPRSLLRSDAEYPTSLDPHIHALRFDGEAAGLPP